MRGGFALGEVFAEIFLLIKAAGKGQNGIVLREQNKEIVSRESLMYIGIHDVAFHLLKQRQ